MRLPTRLVLSFVVAIVGLSSLATISWSDDATWIDLNRLDAWKEPAEGWSIIGSVNLDPKNPKALTFEPGQGILYNWASGKAKNIISKQVFEDVEVRFEFNVPKGSNSGIKFQAVYEVQIFDSFGVKTLKGMDCGGVYPRSEEKPKYHRIDDGHAPLVNACKPPGEWQTMEITFLAPRFDEKGNKTASARITAVLNGKIVQDNLEVSTPTGSAWHDKEKSTGPLLLQGDHGPVAIRNLKVRPLARKS